MEHMAQGVSRSGGLPALYELETRLCYRVVGCYIDNILGGGLRLDNQKANGKKGPLISSKKT